MSVNFDDCCEIAHRADVGRHVVARVAVARGCIVLVESPLAAAPDDDLLLRVRPTDRCSACLLRQREELHECGQCSMRVCSRCVGDHAAECLLVKVCAAVFAKLQRRVSLMTLLGMLRSVRSQPFADLWLDVAAFRRAHPERVDLYSQAAQLIAPYAKCSADELLNACARLHSNSFVLLGDESENRAELGVLAFHRTSFFNHSCSPNAHVDISSSSADQRIVAVVRAMHDVAAGEELTTAYAESLFPRKERREFLRSTKSFECACPRCADPTEGGTFLRAVRCDACSDGWLCPADDELIDWTCSACAFAQCDVAQALVAAEEAIVERARLAKECADGGDPRTALRLCEALLDELAASKLHPRHSLQLRVRALLVNVALADAAATPRAVAVADELLALMAPLNVFGMEAVLRQKRARLRQKKT